MNSSTARIAQLSQEKQALLAKLLQEKATQRHARIAKRERFSPCPLSFAQERLWFLAQMQQSASYNISGLVELQGKLNTAALTQALNEIIRRHEVLRTTFKIAERPEQHIHADCELDLPIVDISDLNSDAQKNTIAQLSQQAASHVFDLSHAPLLYGCLIKRNEQQHLLLMTLHHIVSDEWSLNLFIKELSQFYQMFNDGIALNKPELELQYADFACWQRQPLQGERQQKQMDYWREYLANAPQLLELPTDKPRPVEMSYCGADYHFSLHKQLSQALDRLAKQQDCTLFMLSMAIFSVLLQRHAGQSDLCIGYPNANRNRREIENLIGFFVNTQVLRCDLSDNPQFSELLAQVRQHLLNAQNHQDIPFEQLVDELKPERSLNITPLFQVMLVYQNAPVNSWSVSDLTLDIQQTQTQFAKFDLTLTITNTEDGLQCCFNYATDLFNETSVIRFADHFKVLAQGIIEQPSARLSELALLTETEQQQFLTHPQVDFSTPFSIAQIFEQQVTNYPERIAVVFENQRMSYAELNAKANQLARYLQTQGVKQDVLVGVCLERSIEMMIALLAIVKAGGAYLPIDPAYPPERAAFMLHDAKAALLITEQSLRRDDYSSFFIDTDSAQLEAYSTENLNVKVYPLNLAYLIYTSGSTGNPKGVMVTHHQVTRLFKATEAEFGFNQHDVWTMFHSVAFDFSVWEIWGALLYGGRLVIVPYWVSRSPKDFSQLLQEQHVTILNQTPSAFMQLVNLQPQEYDLRVVIFGGEALDLASLKPWFSYHSDKKPQLVNMYGITETTVHVTYRPVSAEDVERASISPIGRPIVDLQTYLLNPHYQLCPYNTRGELFVGGEGLARGYLNRPDLTAERFVPNPFGSAGSRLYKSGDLASYLDANDMAYAGRIDHQVKIRGFRIELGEIENALLSHAAIKDVVVLVREEHSRKQLVAYLISQQAVTNDELIAHLKHGLPDYMIPSAFVYLDNFPLTNNGKLNSKALPAPDFNTQHNQQYTAPQTEIEKTLTQIWQDLLEIEYVGIHDNFFALGGDSILSIQVVSRARQAGIIITPKQLFQQQTIATLAAVANQESVSDAEQGLISGIVPLTAIQRWFFKQSFVKPNHWNQALLFEVNCRFSALQRALPKLLQHHDALRTQFVEINGVWQQHTLTNCDVELIRCQVSSVEELTDQASTQQAQLNLETGQIARFVWFDVEQHAPRLLIAVHHLVIDGVSWRILLEDLSALLSGQSLPNKTVSFQYWANSMTQRSDWNADYWSNLPDVAALPVDDANGLNRVVDEQELSVSLSTTQTNALLKQVANAYQTKIDDILLTALALTLKDWTQQTDCLIDMEGHGRDGDLDISRTVGWFTCLYPVLLSLGSDDIANAIKTVKEQLRTVPNKGMDYGWLGQVKPCNASVLFNYLGQLDSAVSEQSLLKPLNASAGLNRDLHNARTHEFEIVAQIINGQLQIIWRYSGARYQTATIQTLITNYQQHLSALIEHCVSPTAGAYTPSDFPLAKLSQAELDALNLPARQVEDLYPLAPLQHGLLFHSLYEPDSSAYRVQLACELNGDLNIELFKQAWCVLLNQYTVLRTRFYLGDKPLQQVFKQVDLPFLFENWQHLSESEQAARWQQYLNDDEHTAFDFTQAPLMRLALMQCSAQHYYFFWSHHHVLLDGWSNSALLQTLFSYYDTLVNGETPKLAVVRPYRDYIAWLEQQNLNAAKVYWRDTLAGFTTPTLLDIKTTIDTENVVYQKQQLIFSKQQTEHLQHFVKQQQITLNTLLQGVWALLLSRYSGSSDVMFGITVSGRPAELIGIENMVGLFINSLPMRVTLPDDISVSAWLKTLLAQNLELRRYEHSSLIQIQSWSEIPYGSALFESLVVFENYPMDSALVSHHAEGVQRNRLTIQNIKTEDNTNYPLTITGLPSSQFKIEVVYDAQQFNETTINRLLGHLDVLFNAIVAQPDAQLNALHILSETERQQFIAWNAASSVKYDLPSGIHQLFEQQVEKNPTATAVIFEQQSLTYGELNQRANQLAHYLLNLGIRPDDSVAIFMERSIEMLVAVLGILKAGGAYLPLDSKYPKERLAYILQDAAPILVLTQRHLQTDLPETQLPILLIDTAQTGLAEHPVTNPNIAIQAQQLAYIIYTSGSTGQPKGVMIEHGGLCNMAADLRNRYQLTEQDRNLQFASLAFDMSVEELFGALISGSTLVLRTDAWLTDAAEFWALCQHYGVSVLNLPTLFWQQLNDETDVAIPNHIRLIAIGGDAVNSTALIRWFERTSHRPQLFNAYGPTEATVNAAIHKLTAETLSWQAIGKPTTNTTIHILDQQLRPVPINVTGEIYIGGVGVARGYLNRDDLTAERFLQHSQYGRIYKTGDLARWLVDGTIEYAGRNDFQVKIRGFRIELGEIESALLTHPQIKEAIVLARADKTNHKRLVAYLVGDDISIESVQTHLAQQLADYMIPSTFVMLPKLPVTTNGKVDRNALPAPDMQTMTALVAPRTATERTLVQLWSDLLEEEHIGIQDDFFALGGHSLIAAQLSARLNKVFNINLPIKLLFDLRTIEKLAEQIDLAIWATQLNTDVQQDEFEEIEL